MRSNLIELVTACCVVAAGAQGATAPVEPSPAPAASTAAPVAAAATDATLFVVGLGAIAGVAAFNLAALGWAAIPASGAYAIGATVPAEMSVAMSRIYATTSAVVGAALADHLYSR